MGLSRPKAEENTWKPRIAKQLTWKPRIAKQLTYKKLNINIILL